MASIEDALTAFLLADTGVSALIGDRWYPVEAAKGVEAPYIAYQVISQVRIGTLAGLTGLCKTRVQLGCWGKSGTSYTDARNLAVAVRQATGGAIGVPDDTTATSRTTKFDGFRGYWGTTRIQKCTVVNDRDAHGAGNKAAHAVTAGGHIRALLGVLLDALIWFEEGIP